MQTYAFHELHQLNSKESYYDPKKLSGYFTKGGASSPLDEGKKVSWDFHDFPGAFHVRVKQTIKNKKIVLSGLIQKEEVHKW